MERNEQSTPVRVIFTPEENRYIKFVCGGLLAVDFLFIQGYLSNVKLDADQTSAMECFTLTIPFLAAFLIAANIIPPIELKSKLVHFGALLFGASVPVINSFGLVYAFYHFSPLIGFTFFGSFAGATWIIGRLLLMSEEKPQLPK